jgi:hypothetical protein
MILASLKNSVFDGGKSGFEPSRNTDSESD